MNGLIERIYAVDPEDIPTITPTTTGTTDIKDLIVNVVTWMTIIAAGLAVIYLIYSGILYITAAGNPDQAKKGQQGVVNAIIGIIIIVLAFTIINVITATVD